MFLSMQTLYRFLGYLFFDLSIVIEEDFCERTYMFYYGYIYIYCEENYYEKF